MRKMIFFLTALLSITYCFVAAQEAPFTKGVKGLVMASKPVEAATVSLLNPKDSSVIKGSVTDNLGKFQISIANNGKYLVSVQAIGFTTYYSEIFEISAAKSVYSVKPVTISGAGQQLTGVVVTNKKPFIEQKIDKTIVNVDASPTNVGLTALDLLEKSPGVTVDKDGNVSLRGKAGVLILIDGKPTYMSATDLANYLKSLPSSNLDQIEIMTNPPAKYDASGNSGIINIKTKKSKIKGFNGSVTAGGGISRYPKANESFNMNYRTGDVNLFANYSYNYYKSENDLHLVRNFRDQNTDTLQSVFRQQTIMTHTGHTHNFKVGADYYVDKKTTVGFVFSGYINPSNDVTGNTTDIYDQNNNMQSQTLSPSHSYNKWQSMSTNFNFKHDFDSTGKELTADVDYIRYKSSSSQLFDNYFYNTQGVKIQPDEVISGNLPGQIDIYSAKADFTLPMKNNGKFEAGVKSSYVKTDNNAEYDSLNNTSWVVDSGRTNHFVYTENINAAYVNLNQQLSKKWSAQAGLRLENTISEGDQLTTDKVFNRNYTQLFPTAFIGYTPNDKNQFALSYGRRIERPDYSDLNPFYYFLDKYTYQVGNPYLAPQFSNNVELTHSWKNMINTTLSYSVTNNVIQEILEQVDSTHTSFVTKGNIAKEISYGLNTNASVPVTKWWRANIYAQVINNRYSGFVNNGNIDVDATGFMTNISNQFTAKKGWGFELSGFYRSSMLEGILVAKPMGVANFGISKNVMHDKGMIRVNVQDFLNVQHFNGYSRYQNVDVTINNHWDSRQVNVSFTYRFSKGKAAQHQDHSGAGDEQSRVKGGGN